MRGEERKRAGRNRTLSVTGEEVEQLRDLVSTLSDIERGENVLNKIIHADLLAIIDRIPNGFADLAIIDPPYNLTKDFHGMKFAFLAKRVDEWKLPCVLTIEGAQHKIAETIVQNTTTKNQKVLTMDSMQSTTTQDVKNGTTYLSVMEKNLSVLKEALR